MTLKDRILEYRKLRARKRKDYKAYFRIVEKIARNISKGTTVRIPAHRVPFFKPSKEFKGLLK